MEDNWVPRKHHLMTDESWFKVIQKHSMTKEHSLFVELAVWHREVEPKKLRLEQVFMIIPKGRKVVSKQKTWRETNHVCLSVSELWTLKTRFLVNGSLRFIGHRRAVTQKRFTGQHSAQTAIRFLQHWPVRTLSFKEIQKSDSKVYRTFLLCVYLSMRIFVWRSFGLVIMRDSFFWMRVVQK